MKGAKRGRPKGRSNDNRSYGPLGDLIRRFRMEQGLGLLDVAKACKCSVQFISNIEHGRAPLPWDKAEQLAKALNIPFEELQAANLSIRSDFQSFVAAGGGPKANGSLKGTRVKKSNTALRHLQDAASLVALTAQDSQLRELLQLYSLADADAKKRFYVSARRVFE